MGVTGIPVTIEVAGTQGKMAISYGRAQVWDDCESSQGKVEGDGNPRKSIRELKRDG
ncbi:uncharacterized protein G2W53_027176 [Senna tora]|uniref:Uncharacterized protein n=1 Tax=Senna tora TaxID=362788 RepID=A0A834WJJ3_9FABA|nr:uncharacterized protein G2W53_027176 [Senna tora]